MKGHAKHADVEFFGLRRVIAVLFVVVVSLTAILGSGCSDSDSGCTALAAVSVTAFVEDSNGDPVENAAVEYRRVGSNEEFTECQESPDGFGDDRGFFCGYEVRGDIELRATTPDGELGEASVNVSGDECHVRGENVTIVVN